MSLGAICNFYPTLLISFFPLFILVGTFNSFYSQYIFILVVSRWIIFLLLMYTKKIEPWYILSIKDYLRENSKFFQVFSTKARAIYKWNENYFFSFLFCFIKFERKNQFQSEPVFYAFNLYCSNNNKQHSSRREKNLRTLYKLRRSANWQFGI